VSNAIQTYSAYTTHHTTHNRTDRQRHSSNQPRSRRLYTVATDVSLLACYRHNLHQRRSVVCTVGTMRTEPPTIPSEPSRFGFRTVALTSCSLLHAIIPMHAMPCSSSLLCPPDPLSLSHFLFPFTYMTCRYSLFIHPHPNQPTPVSTQTQSVVTNGPWSGHASPFVSGVGRGTRKACSGSLVLVVTVVAIRSSSTSSSSCSVSSRTGGYSACAPAGHVMALVAALVLATKPTLVWFLVLLELLEVVVCVLVIADWPWLWSWTDAGFSWERLWHFDYRRLGLLPSFFLLLVRTTTEASDDYFDSSVPSVMLRLLPTPSL
jgi:hypothetical protein